MAREQIGTVQITRLRIYPVDPAARETSDTTMAAVQPGTYPVYRDGTSHYWRMTGVISRLTVRPQDLGGGAFTLRVQDVTSDDDVVFYSQRYDPDKWADLLASFQAEADPALIFTMAGEATT